MWWWENFVLVAAGAKLLAVLVVLALEKTGKK
jgi:hypothetical protein